MEIHGFTHLILMRWQRNRFSSIGPGDFMIMTGFSSNDKDLKSTTLEVNNRIEL